MDTQKNSRTSYTQKQSNAEALERLQMERELTAVIKYRQVKYFCPIKRHSTLMRITQEGKILKKDTER